MVKVASWINRAVQETSKYQLPSDKEKRRESFKSFKKEIAVNKNLLKIAKEVKTFISKYPMP